MNSLANPCDTNRLESFLRDELVADDERELTEHLDRCTPCRDALEQRAADLSSWNEAKHLLQPQLFAGSRTYSHRSADSEQARLPRCALLRGNTS